MAALVVGGGIILLRNMVGGGNTSATSMATPSPASPTAAIRPTNVGGSGVDKFGINQIYPSANNIWFLPTSGKDNRGPFENSGSAIKHNPDESFSWSSNTEIRNEVWSDP
jgi:hypothetical protein